MSRPVGGGLGVASLDAGFAFIDVLPPSLFEAVVGGVGADLETRVQGTMVWRSALLDGRVPLAEEAGWPLSGPGSPVIEELRALGVLPFCKGQERLTDLVVLSLIESVELHDAHVTLERETVRARLRAELERRREPGIAEQRSAGSIPTTALVELEVEARAALRDVARVRAQWADLVAMWRTLSALFDELGDALALGWDLSSAALRHTGWTELLELRRLLERVSEIRVLARRLGRSHAGVAESDAIANVTSRVARSGATLAEVRSPLAPIETRGISRSSEVARMLPSEAALLTRPTLRKLWHARRAESALTTYYVDGVMSERVTVEGDAEGEGKKRSRQPELERGPILVCVDTSGSMAGAPEVVAKAITLELARLAHAESRGLYLYLFSGGHNVVEQHVSLAPDGLAQLLTFLSSTFGGGTDPTGPLLRAALRVEGTAWRNGDLVVISDGEFAVPRAALEPIAAARSRRGLRVHGILVGGSSDAAMGAFCDELHRFSDWNQLA